MANEGHSYYFTSDFYLLSKNEYVSTLTFPLVATACAEWLARGNVRVETYLFFYQFYDTSRAIITTGIGTENAIY